MNKPMTAKQALRKLYSVNKQGIGSVAIPIEQFELARKITIHAMGKNCDVRTHTTKTRTLIKIYC